MSELPSRDGYVRSMRNLKAFYPSDHDAIKAYIDQLEAYVERTSRTPQPVTPAGGEAPVGGAIAFERAIEAVLRPHVSTAAERSRACNLFREWFDFANTHPPAADAALLSDGERFRWLLSGGKSKHELLAFVLEHKDPRAAIDAALNQRGGG